MPALVAEYDAALRAKLKLGPRDALPPTGELRKPRAIPSARESQADRARRRSAEKGALSSAAARLLVLGALFR